VKQLAVHITSLCVTTRKAGRWILVAGLIGSSVALGQTARAQDLSGDYSRRGTAGAAHLRVPVTARLASLGTAGTAGLEGMHGIEALFANPAALMLNEGTGVLFSRMEYVVDTGINTFGVAQHLGSNNLALFVTAWDFGEIARQTEVSPEITDMTFSPTFITAGLSYARQFTDRIAAGVTTKLVSEDIDDLVATAFAIDGGITYSISEVGLRFGFSVKNIGTKLRYGGEGLTQSVQIADQRPDADEGALLIETEPVDLPTLMNFGVTYTHRFTSSATVSLLANYRSNSFDQDQFAAGLEVGLLDVLYLRGGIDFMEDLDLSMFNAGNFGAGLRAGISGLDVAVDYAYRPTDFFSHVQMFTVTVSI
jgi:hypothetical protein